MSSEGRVRPASHSIGYLIAKQLRPLVECEREKAAIARLLEFRGNEADLRLAASLFERVGESANANELLRALGPALTATLGNGK